MDDRKKFQQEFNQYEEDAQRDWDEEVRKKFTPQNNFPNSSPNNNSPRPEEQPGNTRIPEDKSKGFNQEERPKDSRNSEDHTGGSNDPDKRAGSSRGPEDRAGSSEDRADSPRRPKDHAGDRHSDSVNEDRSENSRSTGDNEYESRRKFYEWLKSKNQQETTKPSHDPRYQEEFNQFEEDAKRDWEEQMRQYFEPPSVDPFPSPNPNNQPDGYSDPKGPRGTDGSPDGYSDPKGPRGTDDSTDDYSNPKGPRGTDDSTDDYSNPKGPRGTDDTPDGFSNPKGPRGTGDSPDGFSNPKGPRGTGDSPGKEEPFSWSRSFGAAGFSGTEGSSGSEGPSGTSPADAKIIFMKTPQSTPPKRKMVKRIVRGTLNEAAMYTISGTSDTHMGRGTKYTFDTVGVYIAIPLTKAVYAGVTKGACSAVHRYMRNKFNKDKDFDFVRTDRFQKVMEPYMRKHTKKIKDRYFEPRSNRDTRILYKTLKSAVKDKFGTTNVREIKRMLKTLSGQDFEIAKAYLQLSKINKYMDFAHLNVSRMIKGGFRKSVRLAMIGARKMNDNYTMAGVLFTVNLARQALKATYSAYRDVNRISKFAINTVSKTVNQAAQMTKVSTVLSRTPKGPVPKIKTYGRQSQKILRTGVRIGRRVGMAGDAFASKIMRSGTARAAKIHNKFLKNAVKKGSKIAELFVRGGTKALMYAINLAISLIASTIGALLPFIFAGIIIVVILSTFISIFAMEGDEMESREELTAQQYVKVLDECHEQFKDKLESYYANSLYETVTINYVDKKNEAVYRMYENEEGMVIADNNIKECLCLMSALFDFDLESYSPIDEDPETVKERDLENLSSFIERNEQSDEDYSNMTYQWLIRNYLIGLFNGSHEISENVEVTYCGGCTEMIGEDDTVSYYCPGHRHLKLTVTTYYFDKLFDCRIRANSSAYALNGAIVTGSSTIETVWYTLLANGFTEEAAAGAIGNLMVESGGAPNDIKLNAVQQGGGDGIGMVQWSEGRHTAFVEFCNSKGVGWPNEDVGIQLEYLLWELNNGQWLWTYIGEGYGSDANISFEEFKKLTDISLATKVWCAKFERCYAHNAHLDWRTNYAQKVYNTYHGKQQGSSGIGLQPGQTATSLGQFRITYYCPCYECSEGYGNMTATGAIAKANHTIAADPSVLPYGTKVLINGTVYTVEDCGGGVKGNHIDIYVDTHAETLQGGSHMSEVFLVK